MYFMGLNQNHKPPETLVRTPFTSSKPAPNSVSEVIEPKFFLFLNSEQLRGLRGEANLVMYPGTHAFILFILQQ